MVTLSELGVDTSTMEQSEIDAINAVLGDYSKSTSEPEEKEVYDINQRFVRNPEIAALATNSKESYELLAEIFAGNDMYEADKIARDVKLTKMIDLI